MQPVLQELKQKTGDGIVILKVDVDKTLKQRQLIRYRGCLHSFLSGKVKWRQSGVVSAS